ncbi:COG3014 family protein [Flaviaesturariibacter terrae]
MIRFAPVLLAVWLASCASYNQQVSSYYGHYREGEYEKASAALDHSKLLSKRRNHLLFLLEKGRMEHLLHHYDASNRYFNEADNLMEDGGTSIGDVALSTLLNPMMETYRGEDFEKYMVHYYKALNYLLLDQPGEALVEARRISLRTYAQEDVRAEGKYAQDAFSFMLQGLIYEKNKDLNNAFIAYRNAVDLYLKNGGSYYGVSMPLQLKKDLLRTADAMGFEDQLLYYQRELGYTLQPEDRAEGPELVLFWETGSAPVKEEEDIMFFLSKDGGNFFFTSSNGNLRVPFDRSMGSVDEDRLANLTAIRAALPRYELQACAWRSAEVQTDSSTRAAFEPAQNINDLAQLTLRERRLRDLSKTLTRIALGKLAELAATPKDKPKDKEETEEEKKKRRNQELLAAGIKIFNFAREKADTRNWQSLPGNIYYTRIPLKPGAQTVKVSVKGSGGEKVYELPLNAGAGLTFRNLCTL